MHCFSVKKHLIKQMHVILACIGLVVTPQEQWFIASSKIPKCLVGNARPRTRQNNQDFRNIQERHRNNIKDPLTIQEMKTFMFLFFKYREEMQRKSSRPSYGCIFGKDLLKTSVAWESAKMQ